MLTIGTFHLPSVILSVGSWSSFYFFLRRLEPQRKAEWHCRFVTVTHATLITIITAYAAFVQGPWAFTDAGGPNTPLQVVATTICLGYFLFDFAWCLSFQTEGLPMLLHHTLSIVGLTWTLLAGKYGTEMMATVAGSEVTNPLLQLRWFLKETKRHGGWLGEVVDLSFMVSFFTIRIIFGSILVYCYYQQDTDFWGRLAATSIYLIGWMFWISISQYAIYKYGKKYRAWKAQRRGNDKRSDDDTAPSRSSNKSDSATSPLSGASPTENGPSFSSAQNTGLENSDESETREKSVEDLSALKENGRSSGTDQVLTKASAVNGSKNGVHFRGNKGLTHSESAIMDQLGLTG